MASGAQSRVNTGLIADGGAFLNGCEGGGRIRVTEPGALTLFRRDSTH